MEGSHYDYYPVNILNIENIIKLNNIIPWQPMTTEVEPHRI